MPGVSSENPGVIAFGHSIQLWFNYCRCVITFESVVKHPFQPKSSTILNTQTLLCFLRNTVQTKLSYIVLRCKKTLHVPNQYSKIVSGKTDKWYGERVLLEQPFALDDKKTVGQVAKDAGIAISGYLRFELGGKGS